MFRCVGCALGTHLSDVFSGCFSCLIYLKWNHTISIFDIDIWRYRPRYHISLESFVIITCTAATNCVCSWMSKHNISKSNKQPKNKIRTYCYMLFSFNKNDDIRLWHDAINLALLPPPSPPHSAHFPRTHLPFTLPLYPPLSLRYPSLVGV